ncbi:Phosphodiest-domain-containing protein [Ceratobasidium sp. AG-I]|nr:Phosphodiest-domain-containing protein [Ceratobasidium sp. AG-I]
MNNGTHDFRKTVIVVSFDGFRADYLERGLTPHLLAVGDSGLRARWLQPSYPALTFPNHWSIMTGLYPESHGIIANDFVDPETNAHFVYQRPDDSWNASWWGGEPMWETARKAGLKTANLMWPGPPVTRNGYSPTYFVPFTVDYTVMQKATQILSWIDKPFDERPQLINMYEPMVDDTGHHSGPDSPEMTDTLMDVDLFAHAIRAGLAQRNLSSIVDVLFVSDHGMAPTHDRKWIYLDDILGEEGANDVEWKIGQPSAGLRFRKGANTTRHLEKLHQAAARPPYNFKVYTGTNDNPFPERKHFTPDHNSRIPPIYVVPELGWSVTTHRETDPWYAKGDHGYDNEHPLMRAMFIASGPFTDRVRAQVFSSTQSPNVLANRFARKNGPVLIEHFQNVEIYGLVVRLLGIRQWTAQTNGTDGFWDAWFDSN